MRVLVKLTLGLAVPCFAVWLVAVLVTIPSGSVVAVVVLRSVGCLLTLALVTRFILRRDPAPADRGWLVPLGGVLAYAISPQAWAGRALFGQALVRPGVLSLVLDLVVWELAIVLVARSIAPAEPEVERAPYGAGT